jgi:hypothetical protein
MQKAREEPKREEKVCTSCEVNQAKSGHEDQICIGCNKQARTWLLNFLQGE